MKKITLFLTFVAFIFMSVMTTAQTCDYVEAGIDNGQDDANGFISIDMSCVPAGNAINNVVVNDFTSHVSSPTGGTGWCPSWYSWDIYINGAEVLTGVCGTDIEAFDFSVWAPISSVSFMINDEDNWSDHVYVDLDATMTYAPSGAGTPPVISCSADVVADSDPGVCGAVVNFADASAIDAEDGALTTTQTAGPASGSVFPIGVTDITFSVTDSDNNTSTCTFTITVNDVEAPVATCQDITIELDGSGSAAITADDIDNGSSDNCAGFTLDASMTAFDCSNVGANTVVLTVTDASGLSSTCNATVTVEDNQVPVVMCKGGGGTFNVLEEFEGASIPSGWSTLVLSGAWDWTFGSGAMPGGTDFPTNAAIFDDDAAGSGGTGNASVLFSPVYSLAGADSAEFSFDYSLQDFAGSGVLAAFVFDGADWQLLFLANDADIDPTNSGVFDVLPYANSNFQMAFLYNDENGGWNWGAGVDNVLLNYNIPPIPPLEVDLMADGTLSVDPADLIFSVTDNCNYTVGGSALPCTQGNASNGFENGSNVAGAPYISANDIVVEADKDLVLNGLTAGLFHVPGETITSIDLHYYEDNAGMPGTEIGSEMGIVPTSQAVVGGNFGYDVSEVNFDLTPFTFNSTAGAPTNYWVSMTAYSSAGGVVFWETTSASSIGAETFYNDGSAWAPQAGMDGVYTFYSVGDGSCGYTTTIDFDCSNLGENSVDVTVTDAGGNMATCTATVIVSDVTAPVLTCGPDPVLNGSASDSPGAAIPDNDPAGVSVTIDVVEDYIITDLNVPVNISHTWSSDLLLTLTSPAGTTIILRDQTGGSSQDIIETYDDEGTAPVEALSIFDGESTLGTWTLFVSDNAALDEGFINSWGIEYTYDNPVSDLIFELDANGEVHLTPSDMLSVMEDACGIDVILLDETDFDCSDIGTPIMVTVFANDASGNFASCQKEVHIVDAAAPSLTCPGDMLGEANAIPSDNAGVYTIPDYYATGQAFGDDNCTDNANIIFTQDPPAGTVFGINYGTAIPNYVITFTAEDENGNMATCSFEMQVKNGIGVTENSQLNQGLSIYPNPATDTVRLENISDYTIDSASVYDVNGKLVAQFDLDNKQINTLDVSNLTSGVFMVKVIGKDVSTVKQLIIK